MNWGVLVLFVTLAVCFVIRMPISFSMMVAPIVYFLVANPNNGVTTTLDEVVEGCRKTDALVREYLPLSFACVREELWAEAARALPIPVFPLRLALTYPWLNH